MAETIFRGPLVSMGQTADGRAEPADGPSIIFQGIAIPDVRIFPFRKDGMYSRRVRSFLTSPWIIVADNVPSAVSTAGLAALANAVSGVAMVLTTVAPGGSSGVPSLGTAIPILPSGAQPGANVNVLALDFGFTTGTLVAGSTTVTVPDSSQFEIGDWILIPGGGNSAKTLSLFTQVLTAPTATTITVSVAPAASLSNAAIGHANLGNPPQASGAVPADASILYDGGLAAVFCAQEALCRCVSITGVVSGTGGAFLVKGYDLYNQAMSETITVGAGAVSQFGQKAFKYIASITPQFSDAHTYSAGWGDTFGFNMRSDLWEHTDVHWGGKMPVISTGFLKADTAAPTATTGDVRGTFQLSTNGNGSAAAAPVAAATNGALRLVIALRNTAWQTIFSDPGVGQSIPLYGQIQA